jgi:acyl-CoA dehydrogenase
MTVSDPGARFADIREGVARVCARFPDPYWRDLDRRRAYPTGFVEALIAEGYLAAMIPEEYGGSGLPLTAAAVILEEIHRQGCNAAACHAQMYTMGTLLRHGSQAQKAAYLPGTMSSTARRSGPHARNSPT